MPAGLAVTVSCAVPPGASGTLAGVPLLQESPAAARIAPGPAALFFTVTFAVALLLAALVSVTTEGVADTGAGAGVAGCESIGSFSWISALRSRQPAEGQRSGRATTSTAISTSKTSTSNSARRRTPPRLLRRTAAGPTRHTL